MNNKSEITYVDPGILSGFKSGAIANFYNIPSYTRGMGIVDRNLIKSLSEVVDDLFTPDDVKAYIEDYFD